MIDHGSAYARCRVLSVGATAILVWVACTTATGQIRSERRVGAVATFRSDIATNVVGFSGVGISFDVEAPTELPVTLVIPKGLRPELQRRSTHS